MKSAYFIFFFAGILILNACVTKKEPSIFDRIVDAVEEAQDEAEEARNKIYVLDENNSIPAEDLVHAYDGNELRADATFRDSIFTVIGKIDEIGRDEFDDTPVIDLRGGGLFDIVQCYFSDASELTSYNVGDQVRITGRCNGKNGFVEMQECTEIELIP